jgi:NAD-dependent deacetylase
MNARPLSLQSYKNIVVLTGAGISAASGLRTYRGANGLWDEGDTARVSDVSILKTEPHAAWQFFGSFRTTVLATNPNAAHIALAECQKKLGEGKRFTLITQNIDGLHQRAGSNGVIELHGSVFMTKCSNAACSTKPYTDHEGHVDTLPLCATCKSALRPDIVFFREAIPEEAGWLSKRALRDCDLFLAVGTSGTVSPACDFVRWAKYAGARTILVNMEPTTHHTSEFDQELLGPAEVILPQLLGVT